MPSDQRFKYLNMADALEALTVGLNPSNGRSIDPGTNAQAGIVAPTSAGWTFSTLTLVASTAYVTRFVPFRDIAAVSMMFNVSTAAGADDACDVGIYDATGNRLVSAGATTGKLNATGNKTVTLAASLPAGAVYYAAFSSGTQGSTAGALRVANFSTATLTQIYGASFPQVDGGSYATSHPLPATLSTTPTAMSNPPVLVIKEA